MKATTAWPHISLDRKGHYICWFYLDNTLHAQGLCKKPLPCFDDLALVYGKDEATGWTLKSLLSADTAKDGNGHWRNSISKWWCKHSSWFHWFHGWAETQQPLSHYSSTPALLFYFDQGYFWKSLLYSWEYITLTNYENKILLRILHIPNKVKW